MLLTKWIKFLYGNESFRGGCLLVWPLGKFASNHAALPGGLEVMQCYQAEQSQFLRLLVRLPYR